MVCKLARRMRVGVQSDGWLGKDGLGAVYLWSLLTRVKSLAVALLCGSIVWSGAMAEPIQPATLNQPADHAKWAEKALMLSVARAGARVVVVGERGFVLLSDDNGRTWRQATTVPTSVTLTKVSFATPNEGWAVGHMGVVLHTTDGGIHWIKQLDGILAGKLALAHAQQRTAAGDDDAKKVQERIRTAESLVRDGADKPFLSLLAIDPNRVLAFGAFGLAFATEDGGASWLPIFEQVEDSQGRHTYALARDDGTFYAVGEQGLFLRSRNGGRFESVPTPYGGTLFGVLAAPDRVAVAFGLRGTVLRSDDGGAHWLEVPSGVPFSLTSGVVLADKRIVLGSQSGQLIVSSDGARSFSTFAAAAQPVAGLAQAADGAIIVVGPRGIARVALPQPAGVK